MAVLLVAVLLIAGLVLLKHFLAQRRLKNFPPGPPRLPLLGSLPFIPGSLIHLHAEEHWRRRYGPVVGLTTGSSQTLIVVCGAEEVLSILNQEHSQMRPAGTVKLRSFGKSLGLMFSDGAYWTEQRRFTLRELRDLGLGKSKLGDVILDEAEATLDAMERDGPAVEPNKLFNAPVLNVLWYMVSGRPFARPTAEGLDPKSQRLLHIMNKAMRNKRLATAPCDIWPVLRYIAPEWSGYNEIYPPIFEVQAFLRDEIKQQRSDDVHSSFMSKYCQEIDKAQPGSSFTEESLITTCLDLFMAGGESTANTLSFCLMYMAMYPDKQAKVHAELDAAGREPGDIVPLSDKARLPYLEATLAEVMRVNTIAPLAIPHRNSEDVEMNGYTIPKDSMILISLWSVLNDQKHWGDPEVFRPERFIDASGKYVKDPWMIQFGQGKRVCIGEAFAMQVAFSFFANLMNRFKYSLPAGAERPSTIPVAGFTVCPQDFTVIATRRK
ncbi:methyl farnesoate epoxidase-like [Thrips palmi]|uniref:Methyl farnesoate epoxidase-like n=1 Tax=Thrips palmi TaxID=161013 RepID=A0A6P8ZKB0_THRPL|nr:methyl farnesoate epoxidase-like [Thrips palmi]